MSRSLDTYDHISIAEIVIYAFFLAAGIYLCFKHSVRRTTGWVYLVIFAIARILGAALRLATISNPSDVSLYVGWQVLNGVALGPLILLLLGMLGRCYDSINRQGHVVVRHLYQRLIRLTMLVAVILTIVGGTNSDMTMQGGHVQVSYATLSKAGIALMVPVFAMVILVAIIALFNQGYISQGEHRILFAVFASIPFVAVRLAYSCILVLGGHRGSAWLFLGASVIMEMMAVLICEAVGVTLAKVHAAPKEDHQLREGRTRASRRNER